MWSNTVLSSLLRTRLLSHKVVPAHYLPRCNIWYTKKKGVSRDWLALIQQPIDLSRPSILRWLKKREFESIKDDQKFIDLRHDMLGPDLATAHFIVARGGAVKFVGMERWEEKNKEGKHSLPKFYQKDLFVEAVDCTGMEIMYDSFDNFVALEHLKYLNLSSCQIVDDWCLDRISTQFSRTLVHLDLSSCPNITEKGLAVLHRMTKLRKLELNNMSGIKHKPMVAILLEEMLPSCDIVGIDYTNITNYEWESVSEVPKYLHKLQEESVPTEPRIKFTQDKVRSERIS